MNRGISKKVIAGFVAMGVVIIGLIIALVVTNRGKGDDSWKTSSPKKKSETVSSEAEESEAEEEEEEDSEAEEEEEDSESEEEDSEAEKEDDVKKEGYVVTWSSTNGWEDSGKQMSGLDIGVANYSDDAVSGWTLELEVADLKSCDGWNGTFTIKGNKLTITNAEYNGDIA